MKIIVHTKSGKQLKYNSAFNYERLATEWWTNSLCAPDDVVSFGRYIIKASDIDFVELIL